MGCKAKRSGEFALVPLSVLESEACTTLNHAVFKVLVILVSQWRGKNNGTLALTELYARRFGLSGRNTLYTSLRELESRGLIVCTRRGNKSKKMFSLFAIGWEPITHRDGQPLTKPEPCNNSKWLTWKLPADLVAAAKQRRIVNKQRAMKRARKSVPATGTAEPESATGIHTRHGECTVPATGTAEPVYVPESNDRLPISVPATGNTLISRSGLASPISASASKSQSAHPPSPAPFRELNNDAPVQIDERMRKVLKHLSVDPTTDDSRLATMYGCTPSEIQQARARA